MAAIAIDCDGVLANFTEAFGTTANRLFGDNRYKDGWEPPDWDFGGLYSAEEQESIWKVIRYTPNFWLSLSAYSSNVGALAQFFITRTGMDVWIVTSRAETAGLTIAKQTDIWLKACGLTPVNNYLGVIPVPSSENKAGVYRAAGIAYSIDDKAETVEQCDQMKGDHKAYLLDRSWNQHGEVKRRVKSVEEFLKEVV